MVVTAPSREGRDQEAEMAMFEMKYELLPGGGYCITGHVMALSEASARMAVAELFRSMLTSFDPERIQLHEIPVPARPPALPSLPAWTVNAGTSLAAVRVGSDNPTMGSFCPECGVQNGHKNGCERR